MNHKIIITIGLVLILAGIFFILLGFLGLKLGRLPWDILIKKENLEIYIPITSSILISLILTLAVNLFFYFTSK